MSQNANSLKLREDPMFESYRAQYFDEIAQNGSTFFNFFYENNDIFQLINPEDVQLLDQNYQMYSNRTFYCTFGGLLGSIFIDKVALRYAFPNFRIPYMRGPIWLFKYIGVPFLSFGLCKEYMCEDIDATFKDTALKYNFNFEDYNKAMDIFETANKYGKFEELVKLGGKFDWSQVPGGKPKFDRD